MIPAPHQQRACVEESALSLVHGDMGPSRCKGVTSSPCAEKRAKVRSDLMPLRGKAREGEDSPDSSQCRDTRPATVAARVCMCGEKCPWISCWLLCIRAGVRPSITLFQRRGAVSNIATKCTDPKTRAMRIARKRSDRTNRTLHGAKIRHVSWSQQMHWLESGEQCSRAYQLRGGCTPSRFRWLGTSTGERRWICSPRARRRFARCSSPCLIPRWKGTRWHRAGQQPGCMRFLRSRYCHWCYTRSGRSELQWYSSPRTCLGSQTWQNCWWHRPGRSPSGRICYPRWTARCGTWTRSCGAFMCGCFGDIREAERPAFSCARAPSTRRLYAFD